MNETRVETVAGADRVDRRYAHAVASPFFGAFPRDGPLQTEFYNYHLAKFRELIDRLLEIVASGDLFCFALVRKENVNKRQYIQQIAAPLAFGVVVRVERGGEALGLGFAKQVRNSGPQGTVQKIRREMQVPRLENVIEIEIVVA